MVETVGGLMVVEHVEALRCVETLEKTHDH